MSVSRLSRVPLRDVWKDEAKDFTPWLEKNIEVLGETLDVDLSVVEREKRAGIFEVDILAEDSEGDPVVIENQFGKSDHDHLGKILTYLANVEAGTAIWCCEDPRPEHVEAVAWLNKSRSDVSFYLVKVDAFRIGDSPPAPLFTVISGPSEGSREIGETKEKFAERHQKRLEFWKLLLERSKGRTDLFANVSPSKENWINTGAGKTGISYVYVILMHSSRVELYIDTGERDTNKEIFDALYEKREQIEADFGEKLDWQRLEDRRASRIAKSRDGIGLKDEDQWEELHGNMIDTMMRLEKALSNHIQKLT